MDNKIEVAKLVAKKEEKSIAVKNFRGDFRAKVDEYSLKKEEKKRLEKKLL